MIAESFCVQAGAEELYSATVLSAFIYCRINMSAFLVSIRQMKKACRGEF